MVLHVTTIIFAEAYKVLFQTAFINLFAEMINLLSASVALM